jgi:uncharacterized protein YutD
MNRRLKINQSFDILDATIWQYFNNLNEPYLQFHRFSEVQSAYVYYMHDYQYEKIELRKIDSNHCELIIVSIPNDLDTMTALELANRDIINKQGTLAPYDPLVRNNNMKVYEKAIKERREMLSLHDRVVKQLLRQLRKEGLLKKDKKNQANERTQVRFRVFKDLKDKHPEWSQGTVADKAREILLEEVTAETVRNTYRQMGEKWIRADRIR